MNLKKRELHAQQIANVRQLIEILGRDDEVVVKAMKELKQDLMGKNDEEV